MQRSLELASEQKP